MNPTRHVVVALALTAVLFVIAGDQWNKRVSLLTPVRPAPKAS